MAGVRFRPLWPVDYGRLHYQAWELGPQIRGVASDLPDLHPALPRLVSPAPWVLGLAPPWVISA